VQPQRIRTQNLLRRHQLIRTTDPERFGAACADAFGTRRFEAKSKATGFHSQVNIAKLNELSLCFCGHDADVAAIHPATPAFLQQICLASHGESILNRRRIPLSIDESCVIPPETELPISYTQGYRQLVLVLDADVLYRKLESLIGVPVVQPLTVDSAASFRTPEARNLRRMILFLASELDSPNSRFSDLALAEFEQAIIVSFLGAHRHNYSSLFDRAPSAASPQQIRRAEAYIEANWDKPLTVEAISDAMGVSVRTVFKSFKETRGCSPMEFVKELRLRHAQEIFLHPDPSTSVTAVAFQCGFSNLGHFARDYRLHFGELPSETLNRAKKFNC
jgi:AraC-like DNA-binding protein